MRRDELVEGLAEEVHLQWMQAKEDQGITSRVSEFGEELMVDYQLLSEQAKDLDRKTVRAVLDGLGAMGITLDYPMPVMAGFSCENPHQPPPEEWCNGDLCQQWLTRAMDSAPQEQCPDTHRHDRHLSISPFGRQATTCPGRDSCD